MTNVLVAWADEEQIGVFSCASASEAVKNLANVMMNDIDSDPKLHYHLYAAIDNAENVAQAMNHFSNWIQHSNLPFKYRIVWEDGSMSVVSFI